jgi:hypothetical protein
LGFEGFLVPEAMQKPKHLVVEDAMWKQLDWEHCRDDDTNPLLALRKLTALETVGLVVEEWKDAFDTEGEDEWNGLGHRSLVDGGRGWSVRKVNCLILWRNF